MTKNLNTGLKAKVNVKGVFRDAKTGKITKQFEGHNLAVDTGLYAIAERLSGVEANNSGTITYCALGTGTNAPAAGNTTLQTELFRKAVSVRSSSDNIARFRSFFSTDEANDTLKEVGLFGEDATASADSGTLFCRLSIDKTKTSSETLTLDWQITITSS